MFDMHPATLGESELLACCRARRQRRSGPGGQHRNKVETAVVITHEPTGITGEASERRSQEQNRRRALHRLRVNLALGIRRPPATDPPSPRWRRHARSGRIVVNRDHLDFPAMLAEALDLLETENLDPRGAAARLGCSTTQLTKLLRMEPRALQQVNAARAAAGLHPLR